MRVLIATVAEKPHFLGMVPLAWALRAAGHEVQVASQPMLTEVVAGAGLTSVPVGRDHDFWRVVRRYSLFDVLERDIPPFGRATAPLDTISWDYLKEGYRRVVPWWWRVVNEPMTADLVAYCRAWRPDLVIWGPVTYAGAIAAQAVGAAHGRFLWGADIFGRMRAHFLRLMAERPPGDREDLLGAWLGAHAARHGGAFSEELTRGQFTIDVIPPSLGVHAEAVRLPLRFLPYNDRAVVPEWLRTPASRPRVCLSLGISAPERHGGGQLQDMLDACADLDVEIVATLPPEQRHRLRRVPDNTRFVGFAPLHALLPTCSAIINHGGWGTVCTALLYGVPQLILPNWFDQPLLAARIAERGAGLSIPIAEATGARVRGHLLRLLEEPGFRTASRALGRDMRSLPTPNALVPRLERLAEARPAHAQSRA
ncbi:glycosyltransferase, activator-dependent family [Sinosporangium album]|uniref:Glycosyltransferase, activator-dependent family n=1 Tax=Sinosporangium album TaxID=504805 RepID=A0A1G8GIK6_9ACTN|nr:activator-dependent family glycosyltransferase [Sinosporangium album]SDH94192.1 glycosyltransferase, activator-dependent family [Sinosporangium album]